MATKDDVVDQIKAQVSDARTRLAMLVGADLEGGWGPTFGVGDNGESVGPFQIRTTVHPDISRAAATDPTSAVAYMKGAYAAAVAQVSASTWSSDPELAAATAAYFAERPAQPYQQSQGQGAVDAAYKRAKGALSGGGGIFDDVTGAVGGAVSDVGGFVTNPLGAVTGAAKDAAGAVIGPVVDDVKNFLVKLSFVGLGLGLVVIGGYEASKPISKPLITAGAAAAAV